MKRYREAEKNLLEAYAMGKTLFGEQHDRTRRTAERLGQLYRAWGKPEKAAEYEALKARPSGS